MVGYDFPSFISSTKTRRQSNWKNLADYLVLFPMLTDNLVAGADFVYRYLSHQISLGYNRTNPAETQF